jgi:hypothetical protein
MNKLEQLFYLKPSSRGYNSLLNWQNYLCLSLPIEIKIEVIINEYR